MDNLIEKIKEYIMEECRKYAENTGWTNFLLYEKSLIP